ncbi:unnamed protein product [Adineta ricciae]|uniref:Uncharacterized protein n=1 Tax=Adineta ricciae TaxID=249248 RepID=A0A814YCN1_ADIRI|nr:unnamed protein product [Adineta ricciae]CAF1375061.1 unnamed protein product [Adineta ricciae]
MSQNVTTNTTIQTIALICILVGIVLFSVHYGRRVEDSPMNTTCIDDFNTTANITTMIHTSTPELICYPTFRQLSTKTCSNIYESKSTIHDLNADNQVDVIFQCGHNWAWYVYLVLMQSVNYIRSLVILYGNNTGIFSTENTHSVVLGKDIKSFVVVNFNDDQILDIFCLNISSIGISIFFGRGNGTFSTGLRLRTTRNVNTLECVIGDFNYDNYFDIAIMNKDTLHIQVFFANRNQTFRPEEYAFTAIDIVLIAERESYEVYGRLGDGNGNFQEQIIHTYSFDGSSKWNDVADFNNDNYSDILNVKKSSVIINVFLNTCACLK